MRLWRFSGAPDEFSEYFRRFPERLWLAILIDFRLEALLAAKNLRISAALQKKPSSKVGSCV
jgi:hypothetical protein